MPGSRQVDIFGLLPTLWEIRRMMMIHLFQTPAQPVDQFANFQKLSSKMKDIFKDAAAAINSERSSDCMTFIYTTNFISCVVARDTRNSVHF